MPRVCCIRMASSPTCAVSGTYWSNKTQDQRQSRHHVFYWLRQTLNSHYCLVPDSHFWQCKKVRSSGHPMFTALSIAIKELLPAILFVPIWWQQWRGCHVHRHSNNRAVFHVLNSRPTHSIHLMHLLRCPDIKFTFTLLPWGNFSLVAAHIPEVLNDTANDLSNNCLPSFSKR